MSIKVTSWADFEAKLQKEMRCAMEEATNDAYLKACENAVDFYTQGNPVQYNRLGIYGDAPDTDGVEGSGTHLSSRIYMNPSGHGYSTGTFSAQEVWEAAETHTAGVLGKPGRWAQTEQDAEKALDDAFRKRFTRK